MAQLRYANVSFKGRHAGILREEPTGGSVFEYAAGFHIDIGCSLPASVRTHRAAHGLIPFFAHLGPEGWLRARQSEFAEVDRADDLGILLSFGADCIGAAGIHDPQDGAGEIERRFGEGLSKSGIALERTISGVQAKILCRRNGKHYRPAGKTGPAPFIAKYASEDLGDMIFNEAATLDLCRVLLGADQVIHGEIGFVEGNNKPAFLVARFDRFGPTLEDKLRCEDFAQVLGIDPGRDHRGKYNAGYDALGKALAYSDLPVVDTQKVFERLVAYVLLGNVDCHLKNWSLLETSDGVLRLSPIYDALNAYIYGAENDSTRFGLLIDGERLQWESYDKKLLLRIAAEINLPQRAATSSLAKLEARGAALKERLNMSLGLSVERSVSYRQSVEAAWRRIYG